jgi:hypothetical protein
VILKNIEIFIAIVILSMNLACNPIPKKDSHPELPYLKDVLKDQSKFTEVKFIGIEKTPQLYFLKSDKIVLPASNSDAPIRILSLNNEVLFEKVYNWDKPFYMDSLGNIYCNSKQYLAPDYKVEMPFNTIHVDDSINEYRKQLEKMFPSSNDDAKQRDNDSISTKMYVDYERKLLLRYSLDPNSEEMIYKIMNNQLMVCNNKGNLFVIDPYLKKTSKVDYFDESILLEYRSSGGHFGGPYPVYLNYHVLKNGIKFKEEDNPWPETIELEGKEYIYFNKCGLYRIK